jgi:hypothetical protein
MSTRWESDSTGSEAPPEKAARWEDFIDVFFSPRELFTRRANDSWTVPVLVIMALSLVLAFAFRPVQEAMREAAMSSREMTAEQQAAVARTGGVMSTVGVIIAPIGMGFAVLVGGLITWIAAKITSLDVNFKRALMITAFVSFITVLQQVVAGVFMLMKLNKGGEIDLMKDNSFGVLRFMEPKEMNDVVVAALSRVDLFAIWNLVLFAIAFMAAAKAPKPYAWAAAGIIWVIGGILVLLPLAFT